MIIRIVRMNVRPDTVKEFLAHFDQSSARIRQYPGCLHLELWQDIENNGVFITYSQWNSAEALEKYRRSSLFRSTWKKVKPLFAAPTEVLSCNLVRSINP